jgi:predicted O-methyltransferase YrrM
MQMDRADGIQPPEALTAIVRDSARIGFTMASEPLTGSMLRALAASKPNGRLLELGTGTGVGTSWLLDGMNEEARLDSVDNDPDAQEVARRHLAHDRRVTFHLGDGAAFLEGTHSSGFDLIYADAWPGKFSHLDQALSHLRTGGIYLIDDLLPQQNWPEGHALKVAALIGDLVARSGYLSVRLEWASGVMVVVRTDAA